MRKYEDLFGKKGKVVGANPSFAPNASNPRYAAESWSRWRSQDSEIVAAHPCLQLKNALSRKKSVCQAPNAFNFCRSFSLLLTPCPQTTQRLYTKPSTSRGPRGYANAWS